MNQPSVSVIIPSLNGATRLPQTLGSIATQDYPQEMIEIIVVDDESSDNTVEVAQAAGVSTILTSGQRDIEISKRLGLNSASGDYILLLDDDNVLIGQSWLSEAVELLESYPQVAAAQSSFFEYRPEDAMANRYCSLMGLNDPVVYFLGKTDRLTYFEDSWANRKRRPIPLASGAEAVRFTDADVPTVGSQGFLFRRASLDGFSSSPRFYHIDFASYLLESYSGGIAFLNKPIRHDHCTSVSQFLGKCQRNGRLFLRAGEERKYRYHLSATRLILVVCKIAFVIPALVEAARGWRRVRDPAWFLHPVLALAVLFGYSWLVISTGLRSIFSVRHRMESKSVVGSAPSGSAAIPSRIDESDTSARCPGGARKVGNRWHRH